jgi:hypothetical protein
VTGHELYDKISIPDRYAGIDLRYLLHVHNDSSAIFDGYSFFSGGRIAGA